LKSKSLPLFAAVFVLCLRTDGLTVFFLTFGLVAETFVVVRFFAVVFGLCLRTDGLTVFFLTFGLVAETFVVVRFFAVVFGLCLRTVGLVVFLVTLGLAAALFFVVRFFAVVRFEVVFFLLAVGFDVELLFLVVPLFLVEGFAFAIRFLLYLDKYHYLVNLLFRLLLSARPMGRITSFLAFLNFLTGSRLLPLNSWYK
jgi:hypothetical protein